MQNLRRFLALFVVLCVFFPASAWAADPLRMAFVDASVSGGQNAYDLILEYLEASPDIKVKDSDKIWDAADAVGVSRKDFRNGSRRQASKKEFRQVMKKLDIESIMILDVFSKGRKLQVVVIGPSGEEVADVRRDIKRGRPTKAQARDILKEAFGTLVPKVVAFRDEGGWDAYDDEPEEVAEVEEEAEEVEEEEESDSIKESVISKRQGEFGLEPGFSVDFGALIGSRSFNMTSEDGFELDHKSPFVGISARLEYTAAVFSEGSAAFGLAVFGGYAPFTTLFDQETEYASDYAQIGAELVFTKAFSPEFMLDVYGGAEAWSITIAKNPFYTGNQYMSGRVGLLANYSAGVITLFGGGGVLPAFGVNNSDNAFGEVDGLTLGFEGKAGLGFNLSESIGVKVGYNFRMISPSHPEPVVVGSPSDPDPISSSDTLHVGTVTIGYSL